MSKILLYGGRGGSAFRPHWMLHELEVAYENPKLDMRAGEHKQEEFLKINPNGQVPVLVDGDFVVWESIAINQYLAEKYKPEMIGTTPEEKGLVTQWSVWSAYNIHTHLGDLAAPKWTGVEEPAITAKAKKNLERYLPVLNNALEGKDYLVGNRLTAADINVCSPLEYSKMVDYDLSAYPNILRWRTNLESLASYKSAKQE